MFNKSNTKAPRKPGAAFSGGDSITVGGLNAVLFESILSDGDTASNLEAQATSMEAKGYSPATIALMRKPQAFN